MRVIVPPNTFNNLSAVIVTDVCAMSALGQVRTSDTGAQNVRFTPESGHVAVLLKIFTTRN